MLKEKQSVYFVEVGLKKDLFDAFGNEILNSIKELGINTIEKVYVYDVYKVYGSVSAGLVRRIAKSLFIDPIVHELRIYRENSKRKIRLPSIEVWYKPNVTDPVAQTAIKGIKDLGIQEDVNVSCGRKYEFSGSSVNVSILDEIAKKILSNSLIQDYVIKGI